MPIGTRRTRIMIGALSLLIIVSTGTLSAAAPSAASAHVPRAVRSVAANERQKVLMTVESRMSNEKALERLREKLDLLGGRKLRLAAALCDRIERDEDSASADLAFSLVTALIVLG